MVKINPHYWSSHGNNLISLPKRLLQHKEGALKKPLKLISTPPSPARRVSEEGAVLARGPGGGCDSRGRATCKYHSPELHSKITYLTHFVPIPARYAWSASTDDFFIERWDVLTTWV